MHFSHISIQSTLSFFPSRSVPKPHRRGHGENAGVSARFTVLGTQVREGTVFLALASFWVVRVWRPSSCQLQLCSVVSLKRSDVRHETLSLLTSALFACLPRCLHYQQRGTFPRRDTVAISHLSPKALCCCNPCNALGRNATHPKPCGVWLHAVDAALLIFTLCGHYWVTFVRGFASIATLSTNPRTQLTTTSVPIHD